MRTTPRLLAALALPMALAIAACSGSGGTTAPASQAPASEAPASEAPPAAAAGTIALADNALGSIIVDADGKTLYLFTKDTGGVPSCYDDCATIWPPLLADGEITAGTGLDAAKLTTVDRTDGTKQVKYGDWPLYYFAADAAAGDTNGQGVGTIWFVLGADGAAIGQ